MNVYFDNAATTAVDQDVFEAMKPYLLEFYGNPSSIHAHGRQVRAAIEKSRTKIAELLHTSPAEIFFTSGGTEADNTAIKCGIQAYGIKHAITSPIEHHAVLHTMQELERQKEIKLSYVALDDKGHIDLGHLETLLKSNKRSFVSLMHANNEIGNLTDIQHVGEICETYNAIFHSDTVQAIGHYKHNLEETKVHCLVGSAHKLHGPKGAGFIYINNKHKLHPLICGGAQERNMRGGTENVYGVIGLAKAMEIAYENMDTHRKYIQSIKDKMIHELKSHIKDIRFNGDVTCPEKSLYTVLSVCFPSSMDNQMLLFNLDINHISASGGSACSSGSSTGSHVLRALDVSPECTSIRFSFSKYSTVEEVEYVVKVLADLYHKN